MPKKQTVNGSGHAPTKPGRYFNFRTWKAEKFDDKAKAEFLAVYSKTGRFTFAAEAAGVCSQTVKRYIAKDPDFAEAFEEAQKEYGDLLQGEIHRRGVEGWDEPIINFRTNEVVDTVRKFSDRLLELSAKRYVPEYRDKSQIDVNLNPGVLVVTGQNTTPEEWAAKFGGGKK